MSEAVLFTSPDRTVWVLDIPSSLSHPPHTRLRSTPPLETPYSLPEPKDPTTDLNPSIAATHQRLAPHLTHALALARSSIPAFTLPRTTTPSPAPEPDLTANTSLLTPLPAPPLLLGAPSTTLADLSDLFAAVATNPHPRWKTLTLQHPAPAQTFHIPPRARILLAPVDDATVRASFVAAHELRALDFCLLDPPWPNRSAQRKGGYKTVDRFAIIPVLKRVPVRQTVRAGGLVGVWLTNRGGLRERFVQEVVPRWGCVVEAEWVWGKVTRAGEWVFDVESRVRKPYEVLVVLRREGGVVERRVEGRILFAVPDLHSRKPCVKEMIEEYLPRDYKACEIFGRGLTEGWCTWGDEAIKWNWEGHFAPAEPAPDASQEDVEME